MENNNHQHTLVVIGGGAAGFFCAINAAKSKNLKVILLEKSTKLLSKVKISGGGRCNVAHACFSIAQMANQYPRGKQFVKKTFHQFFTHDTIEWFKNRGVFLKTESDGRMFPESDFSQTIIDCLLEEARNNQVDIRMQSEVVAIKKEDQQFKIQLKNQGLLIADFVNIACGGFPKSTMFDFLRNLGHEIIEPVPSLFTFNLPKHPITQLMGISLAKVQVKIPETKLSETGPLLITHWGLSGPVILKLSAWGARDLHKKNWQFKLRINWLPDYHEESLRSQFQIVRNENGSSKLHGKNSFGLPVRLWDFLLKSSEIQDNTRWADLPSKEQNKLIGNLCSYPLEANGKTTFKEEFVTAGGISLTEVDPQTMMSKKIEHLYFSGEILDIDGITGGFNFQNAWTTGFIAAKNIQSKVPD